MNFVKRIPIPLAGVMLGTAALGNLLQLPLTLGQTVTEGEKTVNAVGEAIRTCCGVFASFMLILIIWKLIFDWQGAKEDFKNPIMLGVFATFPMALMILSTYWKPVIKSGAQVLWFVAIILHVCLMVLFAKRFVVGFDLKKVFTTWFIMFCGIAVAGITAPAYGRTGDVGTVTFWFGLVMFFILLVVVTLRCIKAPVPEPAKPLLSIYAAPLALCMAAYVQSVQPKHLPFLKFLLVIELVLYVISLINAVICLAKRKFFPSWAAFTFPFVIAAIATKQTMACAKNMEQPMPFLRPLVIAMTVIAAVFVIITFLAFMKHIFFTKPAEQA